MQRLLETRKLKDQLAEIYLMLNSFRAMGFSALRLEIILGFVIFSVLKSSF